ncbi:MAG: single-stranded-DNA-specific exonuclease RecJ [Desulfovibrionales bacterium]
MPPVHAFPRWNLKPCSKLPAALPEWAESLGISPLLARLLWQRGLEDPQSMDVFLSPMLRHLAPLEKWPGLIDAARVVATGIEQGAPLAVWGDYDVDGITATALLLDFFQEKGVQALHHLPRRIEEGYGLNIQGIETLAAQGVKILITVDCGITSLAEIARARELGIEVVITDHHLPGPELPAARAILNPRLAACPCPDLAGVGVAFFLAAALNTMLAGTRVDVRRFLDLVALGTIADVVPLLGENRTLVKNGMLLLTRADRPGIRALKVACGFDADKEVGAGEVGFGLAPRINAAGRMDDPAAALELLLTRDLTRADKLAGHLNTLNARRKKDEETILEEARAQAAGLLHTSGLVLYGADWHPGIIGIVASRIVERYNRPCIILTDEGEVLKGSGRSIPGFDLFEGLRSCETLLERFGGHRQAAGLAMLPDNLERFREAFHHCVCNTLGSEPVPPVVTVDQELGFAPLNPTFLREIELLQPFGPGNPRPLFASPPLLVRGHSLFGRNKHVRFELLDTAANINLRAIFWRQAEQWGHRSLAGSSIRVAYSPKLNTYNGLTTIDLTLKSILETETP